MWRNRNKENITRDCPADPPDPDAEYPGHRRRLLQVPGLPEGVPPPAFNWTWEGSSYEFEAVNSLVTTMCVDPGDPANMDGVIEVRTSAGCGGYGQMLYDSGVCAQTSKKWVSGLQGVVVCAQCCMWAETGRIWQ